MTALEKIRVWQVNFAIRRPLPGVPLPLLLVITPDVLRYYQRYRVCSVPSEEVCFEHRELLRCVREQDEEGAAEMLRRHLKSLREFAVTNNDENHFLE